MEKKEIDDLIIVRFLSGTATAEEAEYLIQHLEEDGNNRLSYFVAKRIWLESINKSKNKGLVDNSWERLKLRMEESGNEVISAKDKNIKFSWRKLAVAASISFLVATSAFLGFQNYRTSQFEAREHQIIAPLGSRSNVVLPDGSIVWLNSGSNLTYGYNFGKKERKVSLVGEAFFDIKYQNNTSFIVNTSDLRIRVLGTKFNIKSYPEEKMIETTLIKGKVEVLPITYDKSIAPVIMAPNQKLIYTKKDGSTNLDPIKNLPEPTGKEDLQEIKIRNIQIVNVIDPQEESSWKDGRLIMKSEPLGTLARKLERYYNVHISFQNDSIKNFKYSGTLNEVTIEEVLRALEKTSPIRFEINKNHVILTISKKE
jgi:ferric-dicitrate binding protein FerR (iron transport regulator)